MPHSGLLFVNLSLSRVTEVLVYGQSKVFTGIVVIVARYLSLPADGISRKIFGIFFAPDALDVHGESYYRDIKGKIIGDNFVSARRIRQRTHHTIRTFSSSNLHEVSRLRYSSRGSDRLR
jgi:hypothetical protein